MNQEEKKVGLSLRAVHDEATRAEVENYKKREPKAEKSGKGKSSSSSSSSSTTLGDLIAWKKSEHESE